MLSIPSTVGKAKQPWLFRLSSMRIIDEQFFEIVST